MRLRLALLTCLVALIITPAVRADSSGLEFDHFWIVVQPNAPERAALERAGLRISPNVNHNDGQGTSSISAEFFNSYIELMWLDPAVPVAPGAEKGVEKFKQRMRWRESGWCPIGIALHRTAPNVTVPFPTWSFSAAWMPAGSAIEILIARDDKTSPSFSIEPPVFAVDEAANRKIPKSDPKALVFAHPIAVERITAIGLVQPSTYQPVVAYQYLEKAGIFKTSRGAEWAIDVTFDGRRRSQTKDLRPELPMILHY